MKKKIILGLAMVLGVFQAGAQHLQPCITDELYFDQELKDNPEAVARLEEAIHSFEVYTQNPNQNKKSTVVTIPVVFHVIHEYGPENISKDQILDQLRILNEDYRRTNADKVNTRAIFASVAADVEIEFVLATKDPDGNCTEGINRIYSPLTNDARDNVKALTDWPSDKYLNIWVVKTILSQGGDPGTYTAGFAQFPWDRASKPGTDGVVIRSDFIGSIGTSNASRGGRVGTHEVGHWLGLFHTFQGGCTNPSWGEKIADTPPCDGPNYGCNSSLNTCNTGSGDLPDQIENYMDYSDGSCQNMFTEGQKTQMQYMLQQYRSVLVSASNATATGVSGNTTTCKPVADFSNITKVACQDGQVDFEDLSYNASITNRTWTFTGGTPATSGDANPTVTYAAPGTYEVKLEVSNANGGSTITRTDLVVIGPLISNLGLPFEEGMEGSSFPPAGWKVDGGNAGDWQKVTGVGAGSNSSVRATIDESTEDGAIYRLTLPSLDFGAVKDPRITFDLAYARRSTSTTERIRVYASTDCGQSWVLIYQRAGSQMQTADPTTSFFTPTTDQWTNYQVLMSNYAGKRNVLVKFEAVSNMGNNIYLDNINVGSLSSVDVLEAETINLQLFPNPSKGKATLSMTLPENSNTSIWVNDILGKNILNIQQDETLSGDQSFNVNLSDFEPGVYFIQVKVGDALISKKLIVTR